MARMVFKVSTLQNLFTYRKALHNILDISYRLTFPTPVPGGVHSWTMRQMAVFHHYDPNDLQDLWIFFHVGNNTPMQNEIRQYASLSQQVLRPGHAWHTLHSAAFSSCLDNWRSYVNSLGYQVDRHVSIHYYLLFGFSDCYSRLINPWTLF